MDELMRMPPTLTLEDMKALMQMQSDWDWEKFRREAVKDILCSLLGRVERIYTGLSNGSRKITDHKDFIKMAIEDADELIKQLKESSTC